MRGVRERERGRGDQKFYHMKGMPLSSSKDFKLGKRNGLPMYGPQFTMQ